MARGPALEARVRAFMALTLDMVRVDAQRRPSAQMATWYRDLAEDAGIESVPVDTNRELFHEALRMAQAAKLELTAVR